MSIASCFNGHGGLLDHKAAHLTSRCVAMMADQQSVSRDTQSNTDSRDEGNPEMRDASMKQRPCSFLFPDDMS